MHSPAARAAAPTKTSLPMFVHHPIFRPLAALAILLLIDLIWSPASSTLRSRTATCTAA
jgi:simple sugar transport system permease protein